MCICLRKCIDGLTVKHLRAMSTKCLGAVVFGAGIAGKVRIRDISACDSGVVGAKLVGFVSRKALANGKHVLVEFPVCSSASVTSELLSVATEKGLVLHEENIALLTPSHLSMKERLEKTNSTILKGELQLSANYNGWVEDFQKSGGPFCVNVSLIQTFYDLLGNDLQATGGQLEINEAGFTATATLTCSKCRDLTITLRRSKERQPRNKKMTFTLEDGTIIDDTPGVTPPPAEGVPQPSKKPGLFMQDFLQFVDKVKGVKDSGANTARTLHCIQVAENIHRFMGLELQKL
ncbi:biliverdin reductase A-like isoform X2 [Ruditapes philippinarum]|uniref:biliverdin reductase A-like isoform X2 n=1 Tax=Ruditapes philippinarum TaxID=129788 RepID=UPI00295A9E56|nr:biliverdin reductase A-like isoform X2 [Ruditapes philippinarum]